MYIQNANKTLNLWSINASIPSWRLPSWTFEEIIKENQLRRLRKVGRDQFGMEGGSRRAMLEERRTDDRLRSL